MRYRSIAIATACLLAAGCGQRKVPFSQDVPDEPVTRRVVTAVDVQEVMAGTSVTASCTVTHNDEPAPDAPTTLSVSPDPGSIDATGPTFSFAPTTAGTYDVRCESEGVSDTGSITITVLTAPPAVVDTVLAAPTAPAGASTGVGCTVFDAFGNLLEDTAGFALSVDPELSVDQPVGQSFVVRGSVVGDFNVACELDGLVDDTPELLTIYAGVPGASETTVSNPALLPEETTDVFCSFTDQFGNPVTVDPADERFIVMADDGSSASDSGLSQTGSSFSATKAGVYYVFCAVTGFLAGDDTPAVVTVSPGLPHHWTVEIPTQDCFWQDYGIPLLYDVYDGWDNIIDPSQYELTLTSAPSGAYIENDSVVRVLGEGDIDLTLDVTSSQASDSTITAFMSSVRIDSTPPQFSGMTPARSAFLSQGTLSPSDVSISGTVTDSVSFITDVSVLGNPKPVSGASLSEGFTHTQSSRWGVNIITGTAVDECGNRRVMTQSYIRSQGTRGYFPADTSASPSSAADKGILAHLNQEVLDDGVRGTQANPDADDLATIAWLAILGIDLDSVIPNPIAGDGLNKRTCNCGFWPVEWTVSDVCNETDYLVTKNGTMTYSDPTINFINAVDDGLHVGMRINNLNLPLRVQGCVDVGCVVGCTGIKGSASASGDVLVNGYVDLDSTVSMSLVGGTPSASPVSNVTFSCPGYGSCPWIAIDWGILSDIGLGGLLNDIINSILGVFMGQITDLLENEMDSSIGPLLEDFLASFSLDTSFNLPAPLNQTLNLSSGIDHLDFSGPEGSGYGQLGLQTQVFPSSHHTGTSSQADSIDVNQGPIRKDNVIGGSNLPAFGSGYAFGLGLKDDILNQALWSLWYGGGLDLDLADILQLTGDDLSGIDLEMYATTPPVIMTGTGANNVDIGVGDMYVNATVDLAELLGVPDSGAPPLNVGMYLSAVVEAYVDVTNGGDELLLCLANATDPLCPGGLADPVVYVEVVNIDNEGYQGVMTDLFSQLFASVLPQIIGGAIGSFPIPEFDLGSIANLPSGAPVVLRLNNASADKPNEHYITLTGDLE